jgi:hypothetical protein
MSGAGAADRTRSNLLVYDANVSTTGVSQIVRWTVPRMEPVKRIPDKCLPFRVLSRGATSDTEPGLQSRAVPA